MRPKANQPNKKSRREQSQTKKVDESREPMAGASTPGQKCCGDRRRSGGGGGIRTHGAHHTRDFQSRPLGHYGTPPESRAWDMLAERVGFEPTRLAPTAFRERHHQPLGHLSLMWS